MSLILILSLKDVIIISTMHREGRVKRQSQVQAKDRYHASYSRFIEGQFTYSSHVLLKRICEIGERQPKMYGVPLNKIMLQVVKIMMMNELQILFLGSTLQQMKWIVTDQCLNEYLDDVEDVTPALKKDIQAQRVQLSLLLIAYIVKIYLNQENSLADFKIRDIIKVNFDRMYQNWVQKVQSHFKFNPKNMNRLFRQLDNSKKDYKIQIVDYNRLISDFFRQNEVKGQQSQSHHQPIAQIEDNQYLPIQEYRQEQGIQSLNRQSSRVFFSRRSSAAHQYSVAEQNKKSKFQMISKKSIDDR